jgi:inorganic pyrophosphatase
MNAVKVYIEIEKHTNVKYEYDKSLNTLVIDRILPYPFFYPYAYGCIPGTLAADNDELDVLIISDYKLERGEFHLAYIVGVLVMEDEKGMDEKILCVLDEDRESIQGLDDIDAGVLEDINWFFSNYKSKTEGKWSRVDGFRDRDYAVGLYNKYLLKMR